VAPEHRDCISDLHTVIVPRIVTKRTTRGLTSVGADSVDHGINSMAAPRFCHLSATSRILGLSGTIPTLWPTSSLSPPFASFVASQWTRPLKLPSASIALMA